MIHRNEDGTLPTFAWPGGCPIVYVLADGGILCSDCANGAHRSEASTAPDTPADWRIVGQDVYYEGPTTFCDNPHCNAEIESAYGDPDADDNA